jgi:UDP-3-O-[3-hydroxymyristoyl] N-acetylglucosamine deacetylase
MLQTKTDHNSEKRPLLLVVDDEVAICTSLANVLRDENFDTICAHDGEEAIRKVTENNPDLVFLDIWMPGLDGIETLGKIKQLSPETEVVMISGHATIPNALDAMRRGAFDLIEKPFDIESVVLSANRALEHRRSILKAQEKQDQDVSGNRSSDKRLPSLFLHRGISSSGLRGRNIGQRTLRDSVIMYGQCLHSGVKSGLVLEPLPLNSGIHFAQIGISKAVPVYVDYVESTGFATTIRYGATVGATIEHLMACLHAYGISNLLIKCNGEVPIFDGSAKQFCSVVESVGIEEQGGEWYEIALDRPISVSSTEESVTETLSIEPADCFSISYELEYPDPVGSQRFTFEMDSAQSFRDNIAPARTFGFMKDFERLQKAGLAAGGRLDNVILIGSDKVINTELRFREELARHKILDIIGDLFLIGRPLRGAVHARMTGHSDNNNLLRQIKGVLDQVGGEA